MFGFNGKQTTSTGANFCAPATSCCASASHAVIADIALLAMSVFVLARISLPVAIIGRIILLAVVLMALISANKGQKFRLRFSS